MNIKNIMTTLTCIVVLLLTACTEEAGRVFFPYSTPQLSGLTLSQERQWAYGDSLYFSLHIDNSETPLSTLEVTVASAGKELYTKSIRTKGNEAQISQYGICIPFAANAENKEVRLLLTAINVEGGEATATHTLQLVRPIFPDTLYLHYDTLTALMYRQTDNPYTYKTEKNSFPETFSGKISTSKRTEDSKFIWGYSDTEGYTALINATGGAFNFDYTDWRIEQITFNCYTFKYGVVGAYQKMTINGTEMALVNGNYQLTISLEKNSTVTITGISNLRGAYNRDFFTYNASDNTLTFIGESGTWEIYYSPTYNYLWVVRMADVAPDAYWLVGHGFTCAPTWHTDYATGGWGLDNIYRLGYIARIGDNKYQTTVYLNNQHEWGSFEVEIYSDRSWSKADGMLLKEENLSGDTNGIVISKSNGITSGTGFVPGYFHLTFDTSNGVGNETLNIERLSN